MKSALVRQKYLDFFKARGHVEIPSAPLVPENDPTTLFTSSGMQPLVPYLLGQTHPMGKKLVDSQKSFRAQDIEEVGDNRHTTFFEMLGNWSLGDYFKQDQLTWIFTFLTQELGLDPHRLYVTVFEGNISVPKDTESINIWTKLFASVGKDAKIGERIFTYPARKNWWSRSGEPDKMPAGEPGGPDSEVFFDFGEQLQLHENSEWKNELCHPNCDCGRFMEIANSVFMQYQKQADGSLKELAQKNVDFGGGLERLVAVTENSQDVFTSDLFTPIIHVLEKLTQKSYGATPEIIKAMRIITDHIRASVMMMSDGVLPSNKGQGYVLRRLIRRSLLYGRNLGLSGQWEFVTQLVAPVISIYQDAYPSVVSKADEVSQLLKEEALRFGKTLEKGLKEVQKIDQLDGTSAFTLYETYGFPWEMTEELAKAKGQQIDHDEFEQAFKKHQNLSRTAAAGMFKGGLADQSVATTKLHTAHHLLLASLQKLVDPEIRQKGSNITGERLRIDFNFNRKITPEEIEKLEHLVNEKIQAGMPVNRVEMEKSKAETLGAQMEFGRKYPDFVSVYFVGTPENYFSAEFCGGPHVKNTKEIGTFKIIKEESAGAGIRRIYATVS